MPDKVELFDEFPPEIQAETAQYLSAAELLNLALSTKEHWTLFKPMLHVCKFLHHVVRGEYAVVQSMLKNDMHLILKKGNVTDCSGRTFKSISAFEYALWALDQPMWELMLACMPKNEESTEVLTQLLFQYNKVNTDKVTYRLNGQEIIERHFNFEDTLIKELKTQDNFLNAPGPKNQEAINLQWNEGVGGAQRLLPMHVVDAYCSNASRQFYNWLTKKNEHWFAVDSKLGLTFAIAKEERGGGSGMARGVKKLVAQDLACISALCAVRTKEFINLKSRLEKQMTDDTQLEWIHQDFEQRF